jgi:hypothetical protein
MCLLARLCTQYGAGWIFFAVLASSTFIGSCSHTSLVREVACFKDVSLCKIADIESNEADVISNTKVCSICDFELLKVGIKKRMVS